MSPPRFNLHLLGQLGSCPVDGLHPNRLARLVATIGQLVLRGVECKSLIDIIFKILGRMGFKIGVHWYECKIA